MSDPQLHIWTIYDHPKDFPRNYVAREWVGTKPTSNVMVCPDVETIRNHMRAQGLVKLMRMPEDDPKIMETWL